MARRPASTAHAAWSFDATSEAPPPAAANHHRSAESRLHRLSAPAGCIPARAGTCGSGDGWRRRRTRRAADASGGVRWACRCPSRRDWGPSDCRNRVASVAQQRGRHAWSAGACAFRDHRSPVVDWQQLLDAVGLGGIAARASQRRFRRREFSACGRQTAVRWLPDTCRRTACSRIPQTPAASRTTSSSSRYRLRKLLRRCRSASSPKCPARSRE